MSAAMPRVLKRGNFSGPAFRVFWGLIGVWDHRVKGVGPDRVMGV